jgi:glycosyltransferase involved in cell wall biosynthesis
MKVLMIGFDHTIARAKPGGMGDARARHLKYARALRKRQPDSRLVALVRAPAGLRPEHIEEDGLIVHTLPCVRSLFVPKVLHAASRLLRDQNFDLITTQTPFDDGLAGLFLARLYRIPLHVQMRSSFLNDRYWIAERPLLYGFFNWLGKQVARKAETIRVVSMGEKERLEGHFPWIRGKILFLPPLVNLETFSTPLSREEVKQMRNSLALHGLEAECMVVFMGRIVKQKDLPTLLKAFSIIVPKISSASLVILGDGPLSVSLRRLATRLNLDKHVLWMGSVELQNLRGWYTVAACTVLPSLHEGYGKVIAESYLMGTPVIATPFVSAKELIKNEITGFVVPFKDPVMLANKIRVLMEDSMLSESMGQQGREHILAYLPSEEEYLDKLITLWRDSASLVC